MSTDDCSQFTALLTHSTCKCVCVYLCVSFYICLWMYKVLSCIQFSCYQYWLVQCMVLINSTPLIVQPLSILLKYWCHITPYISFLPQRSIFVTEAMTDCRSSTMVFKTILNRCVCWWEWFIQIQLWTTSLQVLLSFWV